MIETLLCFVFLLDFLLKGQAWNGLLNFFPVIQWQKKKKANNIL
jgi:hypothetical protein